MIQKKINVHLLRALITVLNDPYYIAGNIKEDIWATFRLKGEISTAVTEIWGVSLKDQPPGQKVEKGFL